MVMCSRGVPPAGMTIFQRCCVGYHSVWLLYCACGYSGGMRPAVVPGPT